VLRTKIPPRVHQNLTKDWKVITSVFVSRKREQMNRYSEEQSTTEYSVVSYESPGVIGHLARLTLQPLQRRYLPGTKEENTVVGIHTARIGAKTEGGDDKEAQKGEIRGLKSVSTQPAAVRPRAWLARATAQAYADHGVA
jgi:hypothetical protein